MTKDLHLPLCTCLGETQPSLSLWYGVPKKNRSKYSLLKINLAYGSSFPLGWKKRHGRTFALHPWTNSNNSLSEGHAQDFSTDALRCPPHLLRITLTFWNFPAFPISGPLLAVLAAVSFPGSPGVQHGCPGKAPLPPRCSLPLPAAGTRPGTAIPDLWGTCMLGCQQSGKATLSMLKDETPRVCTSPLPRPAYREDLSSSAVEVALGLFLKELHPNPWRWWWCFLYNQPLSRRLLRNFLLLHGEVLI